MAASKKTSVITIPELKRSPLRVTLIGTSGLYIHRMSAKAKRALLIGEARKTLSERSDIKHDPYEEFRDCMTIDKDWRPGSNVRFPAMAFKSAMRTAALVTDGIEGTQVDRLIWVEDEDVPIYGIPALRIRTMRNAGRNPAPDMRTRPFFAEWATEISLQYESRKLSATKIVTLLSNAGAHLWRGRRATRERKRELRNVPRFRRSR